MLKPFSEEIEDLAFVYAHSGRLEDGGNSIYSISSEIVRPEGSTSRFDSLVQYGKFSERERYYSNLSKKELASAPTASEVKTRLQYFLKDQRYVLAFNVNSNFTELRKFLQIDRILDLNFAAEYFLQYLESHSLKRLWEYLVKKRRDRISFSSQEIVFLSVELVKYICGTELNDQKHEKARVLRYYLEKSNTLFGEAFLHCSRNYRKYFGGLFESCTLSNTAEWRTYLEQAGSATLANTNDAPYRRISSREIIDRFERLADAGEGFNLRPSQLEYAHRITDALNEGKILCIEAGTGTGKTTGYLIPALEFLRLNQNQRIAISTYTKSLQSQIYQKEIGFIKACFKIYRDIPIALLKGKASYVCAEKLSYLLRKDLTGAGLLVWLYLVNNIYHYETADVDTIGENVWKYLNENSLLTHTLHSVSAKDGCDASHRICPAQVVTGKARNSRLIVTNHHKLAVLDQEPFLKGLFRNYVIDEANHFENAIRNAFKIEASSQEISLSVQYIRDRMQAVKHMAAGVLEATLNEMLEAIERLTDGLNNLRRALILINPQARLNEENLLGLHNQKYEDEQIDGYLKAVRKESTDIYERIQALLEENTKRRLKIVDRTAMKIQSEANLIKKFAEALGSIEESLVLQEYVPSYILLKKYFILSAASVEVDSIARKSIYADKDCVVYTAATLCDKQRFDCFHEILGIDRPLVSKIDPAIKKKVESVFIPSPFAPGLMEIRVPTDATHGRFNNKSLWLKNISKMIPELVIANKGRTLVLFSSYDDLQHVAAHIEDEITAAGYPVLIQTPGAPTINLCDEFRTVKESVLFGVDSFWYGVDFPGDTLTQVIITRIPFPSVSSPIQIAKKRTLSYEKYNERYYYQKNIKLKQGIGRLIRSEQDKGRVIILDTRFKHHDYLLHQMTAVPLKI